MRVDIPLNLINYYLIIVVNRLYFWQNFSA